MINNLFPNSVPKDYSYSCCFSVESYSKEPKVCGLVEGRSVRLWGQHLVYTGLHQADTKARVQGQQKCPLPSDTAGAEAAPWSKMTQVSRLGKGRERKR